MANPLLQGTVRLRDGYDMPVLGFGTYEMTGDEAYQAVTWALEAGYRHIDSAAWYENEKEVGRAIRDFCRNNNVPRSAIFYTTKLKSNDGVQKTHEAIQASLDACALGYIDLYLIHGPLGGPKARMASWQAICEAKQEGKIRSIGISTFGIRHIKELLNGNLETPAVHQIDLHPFMTRTSIVELSREHGMVLEAWAPLVRAYRFDHPSIVKLANKYDKEPAQILLRYSLQKGYVPLPKSSSKKRIISNFHVFDFELTGEEIAHLDTLNEDLVTDWDPTNCP